MAEATATTYVAVCASAVCFSQYLFTGKERDAESGLDNFGARYMGSSLGRFMSPDPKAFSARTVGNPQKWNKYAYVLNNPVAFFDPDGKDELSIIVRAFIPEASFRYPAGFGPT